MCTQADQRKTSVELADIFLRHAEDYIDQRGVSAHQHKAINAISRCRTSVLGGHALRCNHCGIQDISYNSCRYRHCPKCQTTKQLRWLDQRKSELLPTHYFHVVFTLPHEINHIASYNQAVIYNLLFKAAWLTIDTFGKDENRLAGQMGMLAFLHTWGQNLSQHIHLHCMIPGGALYDDDEGRKQWRSSEKAFLFPSRAMAKYFGKTFLTLLERAHRHDELNLKGGIAGLADSKTFGQLMVKLSKKSWNVYIKEPFNGAEGGVTYLARYFAKTAIGNERILSCDDDTVSFKWRDYSDDNKIKIMTLAAHEFIRRYLSHVLPDGFMRVRSFGLLANACKAKNIAIIRNLLHDSEQIKSASMVTDLTPTLALENKTTVMQPHAKPLIQAITAGDINVLQPLENLVLNAHVSSPTCVGDIGNPVVKAKAKESVAELMKRIAGIDIERCKHCKLGRLEKTPLLPNINQTVESWDTS
jgi:hypothetical protein